MNRPRMNRPRMNRPRIAHIGIIVADLEQAVSRLTPVFGDDLIRKALPEHQLRTATFRTENLAIELLQYDGEAAFAKSAMGERLGLNHVSAEVPDIDAGIAALAGHGFRVQDGFPAEGAHGRVAFFRPDDVTGLLIEICQPHQSGDETDGSA